VVQNPRKKRGRGDQPMQRGERSIEGHTGGLNAVTEGKCFESCSGGGGGVEGTCKAGTLDRNARGAGTKGELGKTKIKNWESYISDELRGRTWGNRV